MAIPRKGLDGLPAFAGLGCSRGVSLSYIATFSDVIDPCINGSGIDFRNRLDVRAGEIDRCSAEIHPLALALRDIGGLAVISSFFEKLGAGLRILFHQVEHLFHALLGRRKNSVGDRRSA
jgi:hypothetical protein